MEVEESRLMLKPNIEEWNRLRDHLAKFVRKHHLSESIALTIQLVCEEWFLNIVRHGFAGEEKRDEHESVIQFQIGLTLSEVNIQFVDEGIPFDPLKHPLPNTELPVHQRQQGGLGVYLIRTLMDECQYDRRDGRNHFTMMKKL